MKPIAEWPWWPLVALVLTPLLTGVVTWLTTTMAARRAVRDELQKRRSGMALERQVEWYARTLSELNEAERLVSAFIIQVERGSNLAKRKAAARAAITAWQQVLRSLAHTTIFATPRSSEIAREIVAEYRKLMPLVQQGLRAPSPEAAIALTTSADAIGQHASALGQDLRKNLGL